MSIPLTTTKFQLVQMRLDRDLAEYLQVAQDAGLSLRKIAADLAELTGIPVSYESVRAWTSITTEQSA